MLGITTNFLIVGILLCASQPVEKLPILKEFKGEIIFKENSELILECNIVDNEGGIQYSWLKNGIPLTLNQGITQRDNEGTIIFKKPLGVDAGDYRCSAKTDIGVASSGIIHVRRQYIDIPTVSLQRHTPIEGKHFKLDCHIPNAYPKPQITWLYQLISDPSIFRNILDKRIVQTPVGTLFFTNVTKEDASREHKYVCVAKSGAADQDVVLAEHVIEDVAPREEGNSELVPLYVSQDMITKVGDVTMIYCVYGGTPQVYPDWYKDGKNIKNSPKDRVTSYNRTGGKRLLIKDTWASDQGEYTCIVDNEVGKPQTHTMHLAVVSAPKIIEHAERRMIVKGGNDVTLPCHGIGSPLPILSWTRDTIPLVGDTNIIKDTNNNSMVVSHLSLSRVTTSDSGYYGCLVQNIFGDTYVETLIYVQ